MSAATVMEAGLRDSKFCIRYFSVRPESMISSAMMTWRPQMSVFRSFKMRTTPELFTPLP